MLAGGRKLNVAGVIRVARIVVQSRRHQFPGKGRIISGNVKTDLAAWLSSSILPGTAHTVNNDTGAVSRSNAVDRAGNGQGTPALTEIPAENLV